MCVVKLYLVQCSSGCGKTSKREKPLQTWYCSDECETKGPPQMLPRPDFDYYPGPVLSSEEVTK